MSLLSGKPARTQAVQNISFEDLLKVGADRPQTATTRSSGEIPDSDFTSAHLFPNLSYTILGTQIDENGKQYVVVRDPRGFFDMSNPDKFGKDYGIFKLSFDDFKKFYSNLSVSDK